MRWSRTLWANVNIYKIENVVVSGDVFNVQYLESLIVAQFATFDTGVVRDPFLVIEALLAAKVLKGGNV